MDFSKLKNRLLIVLCVFVFIFPFWCVRGLCADETSVEFNIVDNLLISANRNYFASSSGTNNKVGYIEIEKDYIYHIRYSVNDNYKNLAFSNDIPAVNVPYTFLTTLTEGELEYSFYSSNTQYLYFTFYNVQDVSVTREPVGMTTSVNELVNNVGINSIWNVFDISINYIVVVVLFAFGVFIIFKIIRKISKGKEGL